MTNKEDIYFLSTFKYRKEYQELFEFTEIKVLNICINLQLKRNKLVQYRTNKNQKRKIYNQLFMYCFSSFFTFDLDNFGKT